MEKKWMDGIWLKLDSHTKNSFLTVKQHSGEKNYLTKCFNNDDQKRHGANLTRSTAGKSFVNQGFFAQRYKESNS